MSSSAWQVVKLSNLVDTISETYRFNKNQEVTLINTSDILDGKVLKHDRELPLSVAGQFKKTFRKGDILYSEIRPANRRFAFVDFDSNNYVASTKLMVLRKKHEDIDNNFLYLTLKSNQVINELQTIAESRSGTFPQITYTELSNLEILLPSLKEQKTIANILSSLDDKIELNNKINKNLEELAQTLYKRWFVDFDFPNEEGEPYKSSGGEMVDSELGMIPRGWEVKELSQIAHFVGGFAFKGNSNDEFGKYGVITIKNVQNGYLDLSNLSKTNIFPEKLKKTQMLEIGDLLVSLTGNVGRVAIVNRKYLLLNQRVEKVIPKDERRRGLIYFLLRSSEMFNKMLSLSKGSAQQNLSPVELSKVKIVFSNSQDINVFSDFFHLVINNQMENIRLIKLRDELLPKLMSGEIEVPVEE